MNSSIINIYIMQEDKISIIERWNKLRKEVRVNKKKVRRHKNGE